MMATTHAPMPKKKTMKPGNANSNKNSMVPAMNQRTVLLNRFSMRRNSNLFWCAGMVYAGRLLKVLNIHKMFYAFFGGSRFG
jgi:hypothetical protein